MLEPFLVCPFPNLDDVGRRIFTQQFRLNEEDGALFI